MKRLLSATGLFAALTLGVYALPQGVLAPYAHVTQEARPVRVLFVGDLMLDRNVARSARALGPGGLFSTSTRALFADADLRVLNLEGTITREPSVAEQNNKILRFTFEPALVRAVLQDLNVEVVSLANNHALDFAASGYEETRRQLDAMGVRYFGHPLNTPGTLSTNAVVQGRMLCFVGYHSLFAPSTESVVAEISRLKTEGACWRIVVFPHWGDEYETVANAAQIRQGRSFVDAGADLVIGSHPHVVQNRETYNGKAIFYSLGNFMFDQNFSWETTHSLAVQVDFYEDKTRFFLTPLSIKEQYSEVLEGAEKGRILGLVGVVADFTLP